MSQLSRRTVLAGLALAATAPVIAPALAQTPVAAQKFTPAAFAAAQAAGKSVIIEVSAPWCPTCRTQKPILQSLLARPEFKDVALMEIDFDSQKAALTQLKVSAQSTLIAFKGTAETARSVGETRAPEIEKLFKTAI
jgi:thioredoxin 1